MHEREREGSGQMNLFDINNGLVKEEDTL
jgi:hypothetical protein